MFLRAVRDVCAWKMCRLIRTRLKHNACTGKTATHNPRQTSTLQPATCYAWPIYRQINTSYIYKGYFEVLYEGIHERKHAHPPVPRGGRPRWNAPRTQHRQMKRSRYRWKRKETTGYPKSSLTQRRSFPFPSPSCARVSVSNVSSMTGTDDQDQCRINRCCCNSLPTAKRCRSCWWPSPVVGDVIRWASWVLCWCRKPGRLYNSRHSHLFQAGSSYFVPHSFPSSCPFKRRM